MHKRTYKVMYCKLGLVRNHKIKNEKMHSSTYCVCIRGTALCGYCASTMDSASLHVNRLQTNCTPACRRLLRGMLLCNILCVDYATSRSPSALIVSPALCVFHCCYFLSWFLCSHCLLEASQWNRTKMSVKLRPHFKLGGWMEPTGGERSKQAGPTWGEDVFLL